MPSYIDRIRFNPELKKNINAKYLTNFRLVLLLIVSIFAIGIVNYIQIPRRLNPEVKIPIVTVSTILPGATPEDVEQLITIPLEDKLKSVENLDTITSNSRENSSLIVIQFLSSVDPDKAQNDVQQIVDTVTNLPEDALSTRVAAIDFENRPVWIFALTSKDIPSLMNVAEGLKDKLEDGTKIDRVALAGYEQQEIQAIIDPIKTAEYQISPIQLASQISNSSKSFPSGTVKADGSVFSLTVDPAITSVDDIRSIKISTQKGIVPLEAIAKVIQISSLNQPKSFIGSPEINDQRAVQFFIYKTKSANIDEAEKMAENIANEYLRPYEKEIKLITITNTARDITDQFSELVKEFGTTVLLIFGVLLIFLGLKQATIASFTVPLTFLSAITIANMMGQSLNFLTLFSFLIALGLLIDDTIVVVTAMTRYYASGKFTPEETGLLVWRDFLIPLWSTTATTIWSFVPLLLASGIIGEFIKPIPIIVTATMLSSTSIAVLVTIPLLIVFLKPKIPGRVKILGRILFIVIFVAILAAIFPKNILFIPMIIIALSAGILIFLKRDFYLKKVHIFLDKNSWVKPVYHFLIQLTDNGIINIENISFKYQKLLKKILNSKRNIRMTLIFLTVFAVISYLLVPLGLVKNEFFPKTDEDTLYLSVSLPEGTNLETTTNESLNFLRELRNYKNVNYVTAESGSEFTSDGNRQNKDSSFLLTFDLSKDRDLSSLEIADSLREKYKNYQKGEVTVTEISGGPPAGADLQIKFLGDDLAALDRLADKTIDHLKNRPGITNMAKSVKTGTGKLVFEPDDKMLASEGISRDTVALWLRTYANGFNLDTIRLGKEKDINLRLSSNLITPEELGKLTISTQNNKYPLLSLGKVKLAANPTSIAHEAGLRTISVTASVTQGYSVTEANTELETFANKLDLPDGYSWKTGGVNEENQKSVQSIFQAMGLSFLLILITMVIVFGSYRQATIVMLSIPLAVSGVFYIFALTQTPLSFPALIGVLALFGIVVTNAIVVVAKINSNINEGMELKDAILDASGSRLEPVLLTSLTTIFGLLPITLSDPLWRGLGGAIISGLFFSGMIKLFFIPVVYYSWFKK